MLRTQISLDAAQRRTLDAEAARTGRSVAALIRDAVDSVYGNHRPIDDHLETMRAAFGSWPATDDDAAVVVDRLRSGSRLDTSG